jgi:hypothetical protein
MGCPHKIVIMKTKNTYVTAAIIMAWIFAASILMTSCTASRWYKSTHDGCPASAGFAGYGNSYKH